MKSFDWQTYQRLEFPNIAPEPSPPHWQTAFKRFWQGLVSLLQPSYEPQIRRVLDAKGQPLWCAYIPATQESTQQSSHAALLDWLEARQYLSDSPFSDTP